MLSEPTREKLERLKLHGMLLALKEQEASPDVASLDFQERLGLLVDREFVSRENKLLERRIREAKFRIKNACTEDVRCSPARGIEKPMLRNLASCQWVQKHLNILITGAAGSGKSYLACALGLKACLMGFSALYFRATRLFPTLAIARAEGNWEKFISKIEKTDLLLIDDWGHAALDEQEQKDLMEIIEDRYDNKSTIITSQHPIKNWHEMINVPTLADAIMDRIIHNSYKISLKADRSGREDKKQLVTNSEKE